MQLRWERRDVLRVGHEGRWLGRGMFERDEVFFRRRGEWDLLKHRVPEDE